MNPLAMITFDWTISLGNIIATIGYTALAIVAWRDLTWRVSNLETWRKEHSIDADARDQIITRMDKILYHLTGGK